MSSPSSFSAMSSFVTAYVEADPFGKGIFLGLILLSIVCWSLLLYKLWLISKVGQLFKSFGNAFARDQTELLAKNIDLFPKSQPGIPHSLKQIFLGVQLKSLEILEKNNYFAQKMGRQTGSSQLSENDISLVESHAYMKMEQELKKIESNLFILPTICSLAPFLGLLGTVWGILITFSGLQGGGASSNATMLGGLATALTTTVLGLMIAIPALVAYSYLKNRILDLGSEMNHFLSGLITSLEIQYRKADLE